MGQKMNKTFVSVAGTAYQVLSASELRHALGVSPAESALLVLDRGCRKVTDQINQAVQLFGWEYVRTVPMASGVLRRTPDRLSSVRESAQQLVETAREIQAMSPDAVGVGAHPTLVSELRALTATPERYILDDGLYNLWLSGSHQWRSGAGLKHAVHETLVSVEVALRRNKYKPLSPGRKSPIWFSALKLSPATSEPLWQHNFPNLRRFGQGGPMGENYGVFVGAPSGSVSDGEYLDLLGRVVADFSAVSFVFYPHTGTSQRVINGVRELGLHLSTSSVALELDLVSMRLKPALVVGFASTVLANARILIPDAKVLNVPWTYANPRRRLRPREQVYARYLKDIGVVNWVPSRS
jgi:hypothetical protein